MSGDDDDFWENDDFIATIENVVKAAEEARAAKHGGSQPNDSASGSSPAIASTTIVARIGDGSLASHVASPCGRCYQAERQLDDLLKRTGSQGTLQSRLYQQQLEVERLSALLLFKDHEIIEAHRTREEREEQLKNTAAEVSRLRDELHQLKNLSPEIGKKLPRDKNAGVAEESAEVFQGSSAVNCVNGRNNFLFPQQNHDPWSPPWITGGKSDGVQGKSSTARGGKIFRHTSERAGQGLQDQLSEVETLNLRTNGSDGREPLRSEKANNFSNREKPRVAGASVFATANPAGLGPSLGSLWRISEMYSSLQHLWGLKGTTNEGQLLLSELYTNCGHDMYTLLSSTKSESLENLQSSLLGEYKQQESVTISEKFHAALRKVANGRAQPSVIIKPLLEFCKLNDETLRKSSLHVLRRVLQDDGTCRRELLLRGHCGAVAQRASSAASEAILEQPYKFIKGRKWFVKSLPKGTGLESLRQVVEFSSPRIFLDSILGEELVQSHSAENRALVDTCIDQARQEYPGPCDGGQEENRINNNGDSHRLPQELGLFVKWMIHLALTDSSPGVMFEAVAIIRILVVSSEPHVERAMFESVLCPAGVEQLLKETGAVDIQLQAVRIIHHLLHCPAAFSQVCCGAGCEQNMPLVREHILTKSHGNEKGEPEQRPAAGHVNHGISETLVAFDESSKAEGTNFQRARQPSFPEIFSEKILEGLAECLKSSKNYRRGNPLYGNVIKLLTFVATSGDSCAANLLQARLTPSRSGPIDEDQSCKGYLESSGGQQVVGKTSAGLTRLVGLEPGDDPGGGTRLGQVFSSLVEERALQNIVQRLLVLIDRELDLNGSEGWNDSDIVNKRDQQLIHGALLLLCHLCSHRCLSAEVLRHLTSSKGMTRLTLSVANRLLMRTPSPMQHEIGSEHFLHSRTSGVSVHTKFSKFSAELTELGRAFSKRVLAYLGESGQSC